MHKKMSRQKVMDDIRKNHNHSWYEDIYMRNKGRGDCISLLFRGTNYTYKDFFDMVEKYSKALRYYGVKKGDEFVACLQQTPDYPVLVAAASFIGAKINLINSGFDLNYIGQIIDRANSKIIFICDWDLPKLAPVLKNRTDDIRIFVLPVDYWIKGENPYSKVTDNYYYFDKNSFWSIYNTLNNVFLTEDFLRAGEFFFGEINGHGKLDDDLAITYTSGSTSKGVHKGIVQKNRTYIIMGKYHDPEVAGIPKMDKTLTMVAVGTHADTTLMSGVSDTLIQGGTVVLEPIINEYYFLESLIINHPGLVIATRTFWMRAMKQAYTDPKYKNLTLPYLYCPSEGGEPLSAGEEIALNKWLKRVKAGICITHTPFSIVKMTIGGGDSEHGSLFLSLYRGYKNILQIFRGIHEPIGLKYYDFADVQILRDNGTYCRPMEIGRMVANSPASMERYHNDQIATKKYFITDAFGKVWGDLGTYGFFDKWGNVYIKGRISDDDPEIKTFQISDEILREKNIMSCEVIYFVNKRTYVAHIEMQYKKSNVKKCLIHCEKRCKKAFGNTKILFRIRTHQEGFPTLFTAKRNLVALSEEGITEKCILPSDFYKH